MVLVLDGKTDLNQISLTGARALTLLGLLALGPKSFDEIRQTFIQKNIMDNSHSDDIIRIDLGTLKYFGYEISRSCAKTDFKYVLNKLPFKIEVSEKDIKVLKRVFNKYKYEIDISQLLEYDKLISKIARYIEDEKIREEFLGISPLVHYDTDRVYELAYSCMSKYTVTLNYLKQYAKEPVEKEIIAQKLILKNDKLYLYGYDLEKKDSVTLLFNRIVSIKSKRITDSNFEQKTVNVKFLLKDFDSSLLTEDEKVLQEFNEGCLAEGKYFNEFLAIQRILSFGDKCTVKEPLEFRDKIISKLKEMRKIYETK